MTFILVTKLRVCLNNKKRRTYTYINLNHKKFDIIEIKVLNIKDLCLSLSSLFCAQWKIFTSFEIKLFEITFQYN